MLLGAYAKANAVETNNFCNLITKTSILIFLFLVEILETQNFYL